MAKEIGFDGIDLTVRSNGYIKPSAVKEKLPEAISIITSKGLSVPMITTEITSVREPYAKEVFEVSSELGVKYLKLGYWKYNGFGFLKKQINEVRKELKNIEELSKKCNITSVIHTHSGMFMTAEPTVVWLILKGFNPNFVGAYLDPGHMVVEGGLAGWMMGMDILSKKVKVVSIKDYAWFKIEEKWNVQTVPLGDGLVPWKSVFEILKKINFKGPISIHSEYDLPLDEIIKQTKSDIQYIKSIMDL
ncbi:MAG: sugar phosphate isomerase/epimerase family protein [Thermoproteota archaeon]|nr:sugar phosphate isomerase/epimerase [Candidatus Brockarchaeota archaeon]